MAHSETQLPSDNSSNLSHSVILHLSDLHFRQNDDLQDNTQRNNVLNELVSVVYSQNQEWRPTIICISGDIGFTGCSSDYVAAAKWLRQLLQMLSLGPDRIVVCPGNHDVDRKNLLANKHRPQTAEIADAELSIPIAEHL